MPPKPNDDGIHITREMWDMLIRQIEFNTSENQRLSEKVLVQETKRAMLGTFGGVVVPIVVSILTAIVMKLLHL
jgi:hypothetical protein